MTYTVVDVTPDTEEWLRERQSSVGASEVAAVMGLDPWQTPLDVYKSKQGVGHDIDPLLAWLGHKDEPTISEWIDRFSGLGLTLTDGFMARSIEHPMFHASFDRWADGIPVQLKTAHEYTSHKWDEGIPTQYRVQVQAEMLVSGAPRALLVVRIGARDFRAIWEPRDDRFIREHMIPAVESFWHDNVQAGVPPVPSTLAENAEVFPTEAGREVEASEVALEAVDRRAVLLSDIKEQKAEADALQLVIANYMGTAEALTHEGRRVLTYKTQAGRQSFDAKAFREDHPDLAAEYTKQGADFKVMRLVKTKGTK
ncbi:YqaJ viral recombinase family protein [Microbacterium sp. ZXX196]|uniref:YqaJ viral recombinase family protein n=1 Tax=Microbacterium sp. ZXX196 TaxID=2609291 RepID=UPI00132702DB|nr:recombinase [Microbacterium sp. ZXX196]